MKAAVIFYSLEGNTRQTAESVAALLNADLIEVAPIRPYPTHGFAKFFHGGKDVMRGMAPRLAAYSFDAHQYDTIVIGTPVWAGTFTPPIKSFLLEQGEEIAQKHLAYFACSSGGNAKKCFAKLSEQLKLLSGQSSRIQTLSLVDPATKEDSKNDDMIMDFCKDIIVANKKNKN